MKSIVLIFSLCYSLIAFSQRDTIRKFYPNGQLKFEYPRIDKEYNGLCRQWHENGQLWISGTWLNGRLMTTAYNYFKDGSIQMKSWYKNGKVIKLKSYHKNGEKSSFSSNSKNGERVMYWHENGNLIHKAIHKKGHPISCIEPIYEDNRSIKKEDKYCYEGDNRVFWTDSMYVDSLGFPIHPKYKYFIKEYYDNGKIKSKTTFNRSVTYIKDWDELGTVIRKEEK